MRTALAAASLLCVRRLSPPIGDFYQFWSLTLLLFEYENRSPHLVGDLVGRLCSLDGLAFHVVDVDVRDDRLAQLRDARRRAAPSGSAVKLASAAMCRAAFRARHHGVRHENGSPLAAPPLGRIRREPG
jgi:hypothetical protein